MQAERRRQKCHISLCFVLRLQRSSFILHIIAKKRALAGTNAGEEIGWRGFLLPQMAKTWGFRAAVLFGGLIWAVWHYPLILSGRYLAGTPIWHQLPMFTIEILGMTAVLGILRLNSNSIWPAILLHASHNYFDQNIFAPLTNGGGSRYFAGETGIITAVIACVIAILMTKKIKITM